MRGTPHSEETKAAVMAALMAGQGVTETAKQYKLRESTVRNWKRKIDPTKLAEVNAKKEDEFDELVANYLREAFLTLSVQAQHFRDKEWLKEQSASELAVNHGVVADKAFRILEAAEFVREPQESADGSIGDADLAGVA